MRSHWLPPAGLHAASVRLPVEGDLPSFEGATGWLSSPHQWALAGDWTMGEQAITLNAEGGQISCRFHARDLHMVMGSAGRASPVRFQVRLDGQPPGAGHGIDVHAQGHGTVAEPPGCGHHPGEEAPDETLAPH